MLGRGKDRRTKYFNRMFLNLSEAQYIILKHLVELRDSVSMKDGVELLASEYRPVSKQYVSQELKSLERQGLIFAERNSYLKVRVFPNVVEALSTVLFSLDFVRKKCEENLRLK